MGPWTLMAPFALMALGTGLQTSTPDQSPRTVIEQALIEYVCSGTAASDTVAYHECLDAQLLQLRTDFGRDLSRLTGVERKVLDFACTKIRETRGREAYIACLNAELVSLRNRRERAKPAPSEPPSSPAPSVSAPPDTAPPLERRAAWRSSGAMIVAVVGVVLVVAGGGLLALKSRRTRRKCKVCGAEMSEPGDLCHTCRHEAAEGVRRAAMARVDEQRALEAEQRRIRELEEDQRTQRARREEEAEQQRREQARQREEEAQLREEEEDARARDAAARHTVQAAADSDEPFDAHAVLGVPPGASPDLILAAYQVGKKKYDPDLVAHLSNELQEHYKEKGQAVERAFQMLTPVT